jgi:5-formaminoimidazole-4-carboxamide-1-beta-D-ribofuranosyl 5'-monophosphate synthetase
LYVNCGDWVESHTAIIEYDDGELVIFDYSERIVGGTIHEDNELEDVELLETVLQ